MAKKLSNIDLNNTSIHGASEIKTTGGLRYTDNGTGRGDLGYTTWNDGTNPYGGAMEFYSSANSSNPGYVNFVIGNSTANARLQFVSHSAANVYDVEAWINQDGSAVFTGDVAVPDSAYGSGWNGNLSVPTKNAVYDKIEALVLASGGGTPTEIVGPTTKVSADVDASHGANNIYVGSTNAYPYTQIVAPENLVLYANTATDGSGAWDSDIVIGTNNTTQNGISLETIATGGKINLTAPSGVRINTAPGADATAAGIFKVDNVTAERTLQFPDTSGTIATQTYVAENAAASIVYNVKSYGAAGDNTADDTAEIQNAINAAHAEGGGTVFFPAGTYKVSSTLNIYTGITLIGDSQDNTIISQTGANTDAIYGNDVSAITISNLLIQGPNTTGTGKGINLTWTSAGNIPYLDFNNIIVRRFGSDGINLRTAIVSRFSRVMVDANKGNGIKLWDGGTSLTFDSCFARDNTQAGYSTDGTVYSSFNSCAADGNGIGYLISNSQTLSFTSCGAEGQIVRDTTWDGAGFKINNSNTIGIRNSWIYNNAAIGVRVTGGSFQIELFGLADNTPLAGATNFVKVDSGSNATVSDIRYTTANSYATGTTTVLNDNSGNLIAAGNITGTTVNASGSSGTIALTASADGGEFNLSTNATGDLAVFGSGGSTLNVNLLDGSLKTGGTARLTNAGALTNIASLNTFTIPSSNIVGLTDTQTLTNKRITPRVGTTTSSATPTINTDSYDQYNITALAAAITSMTTNLSGTPTDGQKLMIRIKDNGTARAITWGASFVSSGVATLLATTVASKTHMVGLVYDAAAAKWVCVAVDATGY